jgi:hypothetical protein
MGNTETTSRADDQIVLDILKAKRKDFPKEVHDFVVRLGSDHSGEPAVYVIFEVKSAKSPSKSKVLEFRRFAGNIEEEILKKNLTHWPYIRFVENIKSA